MTGMLERLADLLRRWRPPNIDPDLDRGAGVREPRPAAPSGRSSAMALDEPEPEIMVSAIAGRRVQR